MLHEQASSLNDDHPQPWPPPPLEDDETPERDPRYVEIHEAVDLVLDIESENFSVAASEEDQRRQDDLFLLPRESRLLMTFRGRLTTASETAYETLDMFFKPRDLLPVFRTDGETHVIHVVEGRTQPREGGKWLSLILFLLTLLSVLYVGTLMALNEIAATQSLAEAQALMNNFVPQLWRGLPYAASILLILGAHELGHYFMARRHRTAASLPYFLPFPFGLFGTFGAAIRLREPMRNRKVLMDIGAAGPLAGLVFAIPILLIGLATSPVGPVSSGGFVEGNSILYAASKLLVFGRFLPDGGVDVYVNQMAWAGWTGLLVTGLNLIPVGQLDGGHVLYSLLGKRARFFYYPVVGALLLLTLFIARELLVFALLVMFIGNYHAVPLDDITTLDQRRRGVALLTLVVFFLVFVPTPLSQTSGGGSNEASEFVQSNLYLLTAFWLAGVLWLRRRLA